MKFPSILFTLSLMAAATSASSATVDFNSGTGCSGAEYQITQGSPEAACFFAQANSYITVNGTEGLVGTALGNSFWTVRFNQLMSQVGIDLGDLGADEDVLFIAAYDATNTLISTQSALLGVGVSGMQSLSLDFGSDVISWVTFGTHSNAGGIYADNFSYSRVAVAPVPLPATGGLLLGALAMLGLARRRKA